MVGIMLSVLLPEYTEEAQLKALMYDVDKAYDQLGMRFFWDILRTRL